MFRKNHRDKDQSRNTNAYQISIILLLSKGHLFITLYLIIMLYAFIPAKYIRMRQF